MAVDLIYILNRANSRALSLQNLAYLLAVGANQRVCPN